MKLYTILDENGFVINAEFFNGGEQPVNAIPELVTGNFVKAKFNFETRDYFEGASVAEIILNNKEAVPNEISPMRLRLQLISMGISLDYIDSMVNGLPDGIRDIVLTQWKYASVFDRQDETLGQMGLMLGLTEEEIDNIFINGNK